MSNIKIWTLDEVKECIFKYEHRQVALFNDILNKISTQNPTMVELGAAEGLYSLLFSEHFHRQDIKHTNVCVELCDYKVEQIKHNLPTAITLHGYMGTVDAEDGDLLNLINRESHISKEAFLSQLKQYTVEEIIIAANIKSIDLLHVDIQGAELEILNEIEIKKLHDKIHYYFISTHQLKHRDTYEYCLRFFNEMPDREIILNDPDPNNDSGCGDSLLIVVNKNYNKQLD